MYYHVDPLTKEVVYIGKGSRERAFLLTNSNGDKPNYGNRKKDHWEWFQDLEEKGYTLLDVVQIPYSGMSNEEALEKEKTQIELYKPKFNKTLGIQFLKVTKPVLDTMLSLREQGLSYKEIGKQVELSTMTAYRAINGQTKLLERIVNE